MFLQKKYEEQSIAAEKRLGQRRARVDYGIVNSDFGSVNSDFADGRKVFTMNRNERSRSSEMGVHDKTKSVFTISEIRRSAQRSKVQGEGYYR